MLDVLKYIPTLLDGAWITVQITVIASALALVIGFIMGTLRVSRFIVIRGFATVYVEVFRGTSALVQLFWMFYVLPFFGVNLDPFDVGWLALGLNVGAYGAEVVRGAILSVPKGQWEAAVALNMTRTTMLRRIIVPQALPGMVPPWGNLLIELLKVSSLVSLITITDLTFRAQQLNNQTFQTLEIFTLVLFMYFAMAMVIAAITRAVEIWTSRGLARGGLK